jgi:hypothetical protein
METSKRFDNAINKLYTAFHNGTLIPECSKQCAVGNILDNSDSWKHLTDTHGSKNLNYLGLVNENFGRRWNGFKPSELISIEAAFLKGCGYTLPLHYKSQRPENSTAKETLFEGLCATVSFLCELDGLPDAMDCTQLFDFEPSDKDLLLAE